MTGISTGEGIFLQSRQDRISVNIRHQDVEQDEVRLRKARRQIQPGYPRPCSKNLVWGT